MRLKVSANRTTSGPLSGPNAVSRGENTSRRHAGRARCALMPATRSVSRRSRPLRVAQIDEGGQRRGSRGITGKVSDETVLEGEAVLLRAGRQDLDLHLGHV